MAKKEGPRKTREPLLVLDRGDRIRTCDLVLPKHPRYQAAPRPDGQCIIEGSGVGALPAAVGSVQQLDPRVVLPWGG